MDTIFIVLLAFIIAFMLSLIAVGAIAYCYTIGKRARRQAVHAENAVEIASANARRLDELEEYINTLREEAAHREPQSAEYDAKDEALKERERQYENLMNAKPPQLLNLGGDR
jgi:hypothetical protein